MSSRIRKLLIATGCLAVVSGGAYTVVNFGFDETAVKTHTISQPVRSIVVKSGSGDVDLVPAGAKMQVRETQHYVSTRPTLHQDVRNGVLTLDSDCDSTFLRCYADLRVSVPGGTKVTVEADSGNVDGHGIDVRDVHANSDSGNVRLELVGSQRRAWAHTDSGNVAVAVPRGEYAVQTHTDSGETSIDGITPDDRAPKSIEARTDSGNITLGSL
jgi:hypothetical protein